MDNLSPDLSFVFDLQRWFVPTPPGHKMAKQLTLRGSFSKIADDFFIKHRSAENFHRNVDHYFYLSVAVRVDGQSYSSHTIGFTAKPERTPVMQFNVLEIDSSDVLNRTQAFLCRRFFFLLTVQLSTALVKDPRWRWFVWNERGWDRGVSK